MDLTNRKEGAETCSSPEKHLSCPLCPAKFSKDSKTLQYHTSLHGSNGPYRCRFCDYAVKAQDNLIKHEKLHKESSQDSNCAKTPMTPVPSSGVDLVLKRPLSTNEELRDIGELSEGSPDKSCSSSSKARGKRYKCAKCPSAFEKKEQFKIHSNLHGSKQKYPCNRCDYAVKYYANYLQHTKKHDEYDAAVQSGTAFEFTVEDSVPEIGESSLLDGDLHLAEQSMTTAEKQHIWLQDKLRPTNQSEELLCCQYCPFKSSSKVDTHTHTHAQNNRKSTYIRLKLNSFWFCK